ncbi:MULTISPECIES: NUDIX hydrolase [unclassified Thioalkalivibrio]|uniref:NUDIX hydrolase n=1 Tax=unclassified Thioalkalivibrio TaxID=2621013 RepID=UPI000376A449|nr:MULTISPECIES: NUDIX hydrolase [unclassified Thioalkalivibrio]
MHRAQLLDLLARHQTTFIEEAGYVRRALEFVSEHPDCFHCDLLPAHVTGSAWVVSPDREQALLLLHGKHHRWFQPGGHADGQADILQVALRETHEETGLAPEQIRLVEEDVFDLDIHTIPASPHFPMHEHIDVRFLLEIDDRLPVPGSDESNDILWVPLQHVSRYNNCRSLWRMVEKTRRLRTFRHTHPR